MGGPGHPLPSCSPGPLGGLGVQGRTLTVKQGGHGGCSPVGDLGPLLWPPGPRPGEMGTLASGFCRRAGGKLPGGEREAPSSGDRVAGAWAPPSPHSGLRGKDSDGPSHLRTPLTPILRRTWEVWAGGREMVAAGAASRPHLSPCFQGPLGRPPCPTSPCCHLSEKPALTVAVGTSRRMANAQPGRALR